MATKVYRIHHIIRQASREEPDYFDYFVVTDEFVVVFKNTYFPFYVEENPKDCNLHVWKAVKEDHRKPFLYYLGGMKPEDVTEVMAVLHNTKDHDLSKIQRFNKQPFKIIARNKQELVVHLL